MKVTPLFDNDEEWSRVRRIALEWIGTPYRHLSMVKGRGADCTLFLGGVLLEAGILKEIKYDYYSRDWHIHTKEEFVKESWIKHLSKSCRDDVRGITIYDAKPESVLRGDILGFSTTKMGVTNHSTLYLGDGMMIQSINRKMVHETRFGNYWKEKLTTIFRIMKLWASE